MIYLLMLVNLVAPFITNANENVKSFEFKYGDTVITKQDGVEGKVTSRYKDGRIIVTLISSGKKRVTTAKNLVKMTGCTDSTKKYCVGGEFVDSKNREIKIVGIYINGKVQIKYSGYERSQTAYTYNLYKSDGCSTKKEDFCVNDIVYSAFPIKYEIVAVNSSPQVVVYHKSSKSYMNYSKNIFAVTKGRSSFNKEVCTGLEAISRSNNEIIIKGVFRHIENKLHSNYKKVIVQYKNNPSITFKTSIEDISIKILEEYELDVQKD